MTKVPLIKRLLTRSAGVVVLTCVSFSTAIAADSALENQLTGQYRDKVLALRHSFKSNSQEYSADGTPVKNEEEAAWTLYGRMLVKKIKVDNEHLTIEGTRAMYFFDKTGSAAQFPEDDKHPAEKLKVTVRLQQLLSTIEDASAVLARIFALTPEDIVNSAPAYWRSQLARLTGLKVPMTDATKMAANASQGKGVAPASDPTVSRLGDHNLKAPRITFKPEPVYTEVARSRHFEGIVGLNVVVGPTGTVADVRIVHPLGMGLDDNAVAAVRSWRFDPATKDGEPVAVAVFIESNFRLH